MNKQNDFNAAIKDAQDRADKSNAEAKPVEKKEPESYPGWIMIFDKPEKGK